MTTRKLVALEPDDLEIVSAHVQDSAVSVGDIHWRPWEKRFVMGIKRLDWDVMQAGEEDCRRLVSALRFDRVLSCRARNIDLAAPDLMLNLLAVEFEPGAAPSGVVELIFSAGGEMRLEVECIECELVDLGVTDRQGAPCPKGARRA